MAICGKCIHLDVCKTTDACDGHVPRCKHFKNKEIVTHADQLRAMSDEELAVALYNSDGLGWCHNLPECGILLETEEGISEEKCIGCVLKWLQRPAEEGAT